MNDNAVNSKSLPSQYKILEDSKYVFWFLIILQVAYGGYYGFTIFNLNLGANYLVILVLATTITVYATYAFIKIIEFLIEQIIKTKDI